MKKKIITISAIALVLVLAGGSAFLYARMAAAKNEREAAFARAQAAEKQAEADKALSDEDISGSDSSGEEGESQEEEKKEAGTIEVDRSMIKETRSERRTRASKKALENLEKERQETLEFLEQYDDEVVRKKERSEAISRWLEKKPN